MKIKCVKCGELVEIPITEGDYEEWKGSGELVQQKFSDLSTDHREMLISGICPKCWNKLFQTYFVKFDGMARLMNVEELKDLINKALIHNNDITEVSIILLDERLTKEQALTVAEAFNFEYEVGESLKSGNSPMEALEEWDLI